MDAFSTRIWHVFKTPKDTYLKHQIRLFYKDQGPKGGNSAPGSRQRELIEPTRPLRASQLIHQSGAGGGLSALHDHRLDTLRGLQQKEFSISAGGIKRHLTPFNAI